MTQTRNRRFGLSKSKITAFEQCPKKLWLATHRPELAEQDEGAEARFATGNAVGEIACALHPGGAMVDPPSLSEALAKTSALIAGGHPGPIFEATFEHDGVLVRVDVLEKVEGGGWAAAEVKSSGKVKDYHRGDLATQVSNQPGAASENWDLDQWMSASFGIWREEGHDIVLRVAPESAERARKWRFHPLQVIEQDGEELVIRFNSGGLREIAEHLFTWGGEVRIEGPEELRKVMRDRLASNLVALDTHQKLSGTP